MDDLLNVLIAIYFLALLIIAICSIIPKRKRKKAQPKQNGYYEWGNYDENDER